MTAKYKMGVEVNINTKSSPAFSAESKPDSNAPQTEADSPFCIAVLGDFSGRANHLQHEPETINKRRFIEINRDNLEQVMAEFAISLKLNPEADDAIQIDLGELDDFHPDELYAKLESFSKLRSLRRRLKNNKTFAKAAAEIQSWIPESLSTDVAEKAEETSGVSTEVNIPTENLLDNILDSQQQNTTALSAETMQIDNLIKSIIAPYVEPAKDPRQDDMVAIVDTAIQTHMRNILHHADFQAMESAWQSLYFLVKRLETGSKLKIFILDITRQEIQADLSVDDIRSSAIYRRFCDSAEGDLPWSVLLGNYTFTDSIEDALSLASIGTIAQLARAPFIAAASETLAGCKSFALAPDYADWNYAMSEGVTKAWEMLRQSSVASSIGLTLPRFMLRLPYGKKSKPIDAFAFEEMPAGHNHAAYLWGNAAFIKAELLARSFINNGWNMQPGEIQQTDDLPVHYYEEDGETVSKPVAEILLTEKGGEILSKHGLMPLWSVRNMDSIRSSDFRSVAENGEKIKGRWA